MQQRNTCPTCGQRPRSRREHNHCFAVIERAFENWPETAAFTPDSADHLRAHLLMATGYVHSTFIESEDPRSLAFAIERIFEAQRKRGTYSSFSILPTGVMIHSPRSMSEKAMGKQTFQEASNAIFSLISEVLGVPIEQLTAPSNAMEAA